VYHKEQEEWANKLNERIRVHAPRAGDIEMNVAPTRVLQIENQKLQLEKHIRRAGAKFNKGLAVVDRDENGVFERRMQENAWFCGPIGDTEGEFHVSRIGSESQDRRTTFPGFVGEKG
jgi:hypothetical protein